MRPTALRHRARALDQGESAYLYGVDTLILQIAGEAAQGRLKGQQGQGASREPRPLLPLLTHACVRCRVILRQFGFQLINFSGAADISRRFQFWSQWLETGFGNH